MTRIGSSRSPLSSRTAWIARIAASPRLTMARRWKGRARGATARQLPASGWVDRDRTEPDPTNGGFYRRLRGRYATVDEMPEPALTPHEMTLHGHRVSYRRGGS